MYAEVAVDFPSGTSKTYTYAVPADLALSPGDLVLAPFGVRTLPGIVFAVTPETSIDRPRDILKRLSPEPVLSKVRLQLATWLSTYYLCPLYEAAALLLAPGGDPHTRTIFRPVENPAPAALDSLDDEERYIYDFIAGKGKAELGTVKKEFLRLRPSPILDRLVRKKLLRKISEASQPTVGPKVAWRLELVETAPSEPVKGGKAQALVALLTEAGGSLDLARVHELLGPIPTTLSNLERRGLVRRISVEVRREPVAPQTKPAPQALELSPAQREAWRHIEASLGEDRAQGARVFLLHGVTGSGKTELYLLALAEAARRGRQAIVLVPEIALTPQTVQQFAARFPGRVAVLHSALSAGEQYDEWMRIKEGRADVVIGSRGAIFSPAPHLGLIVMDEEHEWTYKQDLQSPRYHTRDVAVQLAELTGAVVILGSATPDVTSYHHARQGDYRLVTLPERVSQNGPLPLPHVDLVDLRSELRQGNRSIFSRSLQSAMKEALDKDEQIILFLNRRGAASIVVCRECGYVMQCRRCDLPLTFHSQESGLVCHQCNLRRPAPDLCPSCGSDKIRYLGVGTQKVAEEAASLLPGARILRWDRDVTGHRKAHEAILRRFAGHQADILVGTQMIAKGLHLPLVTLVGVVNADLGLHLPDFRAAERTFQILTQVAGRAGRGSWGGRVIIQTYTPHNYALAAASKHDYHSFYEQEIGHRRSMGNPPFSRLVRLLYSNSNSQTCERETFRMLSLLRGEMETKEHRGIQTIGPAPCYFSRVRGRYRWQLVLRGKNPRDLLESIVMPHGWTLDVDPMSLL